VTWPGIATESASAVAQGAGGARRAVVEWLGRRPYAPLLERQRALQQQVAAGEAPDTLLLVEHDPVVTLGRREDRAGIPVPEALARAGIAVVPTERGGNVTYHGPGQLVAYPILDLRALDEDVVRFMRSLEESIIRTVGDFGIAAGRRRGYPGVWVEEAKIAAVGVAVKRRVTMHGFALNVAPDLAHFSFINPCGLGREVTSMAMVLGRPVPLANVRARTAARFAEVYALDLIPVTRSALVGAAESDSVPAPA